MWSWIEHIYFLRRFLLGCAFVMAASPIIGQITSLQEKQLFFEQLTGPDLDQRTINNIFQDSDGYLWIATWSGLFRYYGNNYEVYKADQEQPGQLRSNKITCITEDHEGYIWIGTRVGGAYKYDKNRGYFEHYEFDALDSTSLSNNNVWDIEVDSDGRIWLATEDGLNYTTTSGFRRINVEHGLIDPFVTSISTASKNHIWLTTASGLNLIRKGEKFDIQSIRFETQKDDDLHNYYYGSAITRIAGEERTFFASKKGIKEWNGEQLINHLYDIDESSYNFFRTLTAVDGARPMVLAGSEQGLFFFEPETNAFTRLVDVRDENTNLSHNTITKVFIDQTEVLWVGTKRGLNYFDTYDHGFKNFDTDDFDAERNVIMGIVPRDSLLWLGTMGGGTYTFNPETESFAAVEIATGPDDQYIDFVQTLHLGSDNEVYLGTAGGGVYLLKPEVENGQVLKFQNFIKFCEKSEEKLTDNYVMSMGQSADGGVWVGTWSGGLNKIYPDGRTLNYQTELLLKSPLVEIKEFGNTLWIGSRGNGLYRYVLKGNELEKVTVFQSTDDPNSISSNFISSILMDARGSVWVGTEGGLDLYLPDLNGFRRFSDFPSTVNHEVYGVFEDNREQFWLTNREGLTLATFKNNDFQVINQFDGYDRLEAGKFMGVVSTGDIFVGGTSGFSLINSEKLNRNPHLPKVIISSVSVFNERLPVGKRFHGRVVLDRRLEETSSIQLDHDENAISIEFSALHFASPGKLRYAYKLEGYEGEWQYTDQERAFANYTNLGNGHYTFYVKASNNDGLWTEQPITLQFIVLPPWWKTYWAFGGYVLLVCLFLLGFRSLIITRTRYENSLTLERVERENVEKRSKEKLQFFTNISHEFRTPLTLIQGPVESLLEQSSGSRQLKEQLTIVRNNTDRLLRLINQLLDFRKVETGHLHLQVAEGDFVRFIKEIKLSFDAKAEEDQVNFVFESSAHSIKLFFDRDQCEKIVFNLLSNAFKHVPGSGKVTIGLMEKADTVDLRVTNTGPGIPKREIDKIFDRFYSNTDHAYAGTGTGIGLALVNSLVKLHGAHIHVESVENEHTSFTVTFKKGAGHFNEEDILQGFEGSDSLQKYYDADDFESGVMEEESNPDLEGADKILIVEDNREVRTYIKSLFAADHLILEANNGQEGMKLAEEEVPDVVISDVMMPVMDGIALCKKLKSNPKTSHIPVILLTARTSLIFKVDGYENGADDYMTKPFSGKVLKVRARNLIEQRRQLQQLFHNKQLLEVQPSMISYTSADEQFLEQALESIEANISNTDYSVVDLRKDVGMSRMQLYRKLKTLIGLSGNEFIRSIRLKRAAQLIKVGEYTIAEITYMVGFGDLQYFRECFKKEFGVNPSEYTDTQNQAEEV